ncbi:MAG: class I SAM-dependent methyltransferase [Nostocales cyanobacterium]|nr:MAG: class I SAM-dependent methyltransferase [Nostocales cyanobacterium]TAF18136.1 MAG: class I SAM-dependent methyltransferase [Nostocales cyanobacterium]
MQELREIIYSQDLELKKTWYSPVADAYNKVRPRYPQDIINRTIEITQLSAKSKILELGCGPGNATVSFAELGCSMICLEPSLTACELAKKNCISYPHVDIQQTTFEEWQLTSEKFDAVLAATSFHWINTAVAYTKTAEVLKDDGYLILLWNMTPQADYEVYQQLHQVYQIHAPAAARYEDMTTQVKIVKSFGQNAINSGKFQDLISEHLICEITYDVDDYLLLLGTLSPYLKLDLSMRNALFSGLKEQINQFCGGKINVSYISAVQIMKKVKGNREQKK